VGVVGIGLMGSGIAEVCARNGCDVVAYETADAALSAGRDRIERSLGRALDKDKLTEGDHDAALQRIRFSTDLGELADREFVFEAIVESEPEKVELFQRLDKVVA